ncbi:MAG: DUF2059 domain-containing protein [Lysobacteraceae bacterium]
MKTAFLGATAALALTLFAPSTAHADQARAERLIEATGVQGNYVGMQQQMMQAAAQQFMQSAQQRGISQEQAQAARPQMEQVFQRVEQVLDWDELRPQLVALYAEVFTTAELQAALDYYTSAEGRSFMEKQGPLIERGSGIIQERFNAAIPEIEAGIEAALEAAAAAPASAPQGE